MNDISHLTDRPMPLAMSSDQFRDLGHRLVDQIAELLEALPELRVAPDEPPTAARDALGDQPLPRTGSDPTELLEQMLELTKQHALYTAHPRFWGYVMGSVSPIGVLGDLLGSAVNANVGGWNGAPVGSAVERQTIRWIAELIAYPVECGGILTSGGSVANYLGLLCARHRAGGPSASQRLYASRSAHSWLSTAIDVFGFGEDAVRWIDMDEDERMQIAALEEAIADDLAQGRQPLAIIGTAGTVSTGAVDPLPRIARIAADRGLWFHVDGAYGALAVAADADTPADLEGLRQADSIALDPHKWLHAPLDVGCALVRDAELLRATFSQQTTYYPTESGQQDVQPTSYRDLGLQTSRSFRALKVWLNLAHAGGDGYARMIGDDIALARVLYRRIQDHAEIDALTQSLSITTFRYVPDGVDDAEYLDQLNVAILHRLQRSGQVYFSHATVRGVFALRVCIVNWRTTLADIEALPDLVASTGRELHTG